MPFFIILVGYFQRAKEGKERKRRKKKKKRKRKEQEEEEEEEQQEMHLLLRGGGSRGARVAVCYEVAGREELMAIAVCFEELVATASRYALLPFFFFFFLFSFFLFFLSCRSKHT